MKIAKSKCAICRTIKPYSFWYPKNFSVRDLSTKVFSARRVPDKIHGTIVQCDRCGLVRSLEKIPTSYLEKLYQKSKFTYQNQVKNLTNSYIESIKVASRYLSSKKSILEIGCGNGFLFGSLKKIGFKKIHGVEPSYAAIREADTKDRSKIRQGFFQQGLFSSNSFDMIAAFQVFDHVSDPNKFLVNCKKLIKKNGLLVLMNHNVDSMSAKILGENSPIFDIEHTYLYSPKTIRNLLKKHGFTIKHAYSPSATMSVRYLLQLLPLPKIVKSRLINLRNTIFDKNITLYPGNLCVIAKKTK